MKYIEIINKNGCYLGAVFLPPWITDVLPGKRGDTQNKQLGRTSARCKV